jgi:hypothetical protein
MIGLLTLKFPSVISNYRQFAKNCTIKLGSILNSIPLFSLKGYRARLAGRERVVKISATPATDPFKAAGDGIAND